MNEHMYIQLHSAADRLALEAARVKAIPNTQAECYIENYEKVLEFLISEYEKHDPKDD